MKSREDRGASIVEYGGLMLLVAAIVATLVASDIDDTIVKKIKGAIEDVFDGK
jgi:Flp pilus assembly pilin Flp